VHIMHCYAKGIWCSGITFRLHRKGLRFEPGFVHFFPSDFLSSIRRYVPKRNEGIFIFSFTLLIRLAIHRGGGE
jgi:hypothetical protein